MKQYYEYAAKEAKIIKAIDELVVSEFGDIYIKTEGDAFDFMPPVQFCMNTLRNAVSSMSIDEPLNIGGLIIRTDGTNVNVDYDSTTAVNDIPSAVFLALDSVIRAEVITHGNVNIVIDDMISVSAIATEIYEGDYEVKIKYSPAKDLKILCKLDTPPRD